MRYPRSKGKVLRVFCHGGSSARSDGRSGRRPPPAQPTFDTQGHTAFRPGTLFNCPPVSSANNAVRAINRAKGCVHVGAAIPKHTPRKAIVAHRLEIECRGQVSLIRAVCLGDFGTGMIRDEGRAIEGHFGLAILFRSNSI